MKAQERTALIDRIYQVDNSNIYGFFKEHRFLSNFHLCAIVFEGQTFGSTEAAYQAAKSLDPEVRNKFTMMQPSEAKREGQKINIREDWEENKLAIMYEICFRKFHFHDDLEKLLLATGEKYLEETNYWGDRFWGADLKHKGENNLGKILMRIRKTF